ncbi:hypothetical protein FGO68_gene7689 [Halteria grandinella]|uniref:Uncharacterized protein n=1 Tax=Halteria grandinella TaxID=5974 RepID=A0A8J8NY03_HALGN|nr:hypothetical protein FGO68_gene7689 [Halteria grandinella]
MNHALDTKILRKKNNILRVAASIFISITINAHRQLPSRHKSSQQMIFLQHNRHSPILRGGIQLRELLKRMNAKGAYLGLWM